jgi:glycosyltransferase involved in cell wall biosynthesis
MTIWHLLTPEFAPQSGGVADYTHSVANGLAEAGDEVHVWCPPVKNLRSVHDRIIVHPQLGSARAIDLRRVAAELNRFPKPRRLLVQWVPHAYGCRAMNVGFCFWLWRRSVLSSDRVEIMVHEPYLSFTEHAWQHAAVALVHRLMTVMLLGAAAHVWIAIPSWQNRWGPYALGRRVPFTWLPVPSNVPSVSPSPADARRIHDDYAGQAGLLIGHFGTYGRGVTTLLERLLPPIMAHHASPTLVLAGTGSDDFRQRLITAHPELAGRVHAVGHVPATEIALHLTACDLLIQPYPDGVSTRRTSAMAGLSLGQAIVTTRGHLTEPLWDESGAVLLADVTNVPGFVAQVARLLCDGAERRRLGDVARALYRDRFDLRHTIVALRRSMAA